MLDHLQSLYSINESCARHRDGIHVPRRRLLRSLEVDNTAKIVSCNLWCRSRNIHDRSAILSKPDSRLSIFPMSLSSFNRASCTDASATVSLDSFAKCSRSSRTWRKSEQRTVSRSDRHIEGKLAEFTHHQCPCAPASTAYRSIRWARSRWWARCHPYP